MDNTKKRKKKKTVLKQARKYARKGWFGRGTHVDQETYEYFLRIYEMKIDEFESEEEKVTVANNALKQTEGHEVELSSNQFISRVIEKLLPLAEDEIIFRFIDAFADLRIICTDSFASHVVQTLVKICSAKFRKEKNKKYHEFVNKTSQFIFNNLEEFIYNPYANQIGRCCLKECSGFANEEPLSSETVENLGTRILKWPQIQDMAVNDLTSGFLQCLLQCLSVVNVKLTQKIIKRCIEECFLCDTGEEIKKNEDPKIATFFESMPTTRLLEMCIEVSTGKRYTQIFLNIFINRLKLLSCNKLSVIAVQKIISHCPEVSEFKLMMQELVPNFSDIIAAGHLGVVSELAKACIRLVTSEGEFLKGLKVGLKVENSCCGELITKIIKPNGTKIDKNGSLLIQTLFQFKKPITVVESLLALDSKVLKEIFLDPRGSYIADAYVSSKMIGEKSRERLVQKLKGSYKELAVSNHGSRVVEALWSRANLKEKHIIMGELDRSVSRTLPGSIIATKFRLGLYISDKAKWASTESKSPAKIFSDVI